MPNDYEIGVGFEPDAYPPIMPEDTPPAKIGSTKALGAATGIAAAFNCQAEIAGKTAAVFTTGGNIDPARFCSLVNAAG